MSSDADVLVPLKYGTVKKLRMLQLQSTAIKSIDDTINDLINFFSIDDLPEEWQFFDA